LERLDGGANALTDEEREIETILDTNKPKQHIEKTVRNIPETGEAEVEEEVKSENHKSENSTNS